MGSYLIDLDLLQRMLMDLSENEKFKIDEQFLFQNYARLNFQNVLYTTTILYTYSQ